MPPAAAMAAAVAAHHETLPNSARLRDLLAGDTSALRSVLFADDFGIKDEHVISLVEAVGPQLTALQLGCSETGNGSFLTNAAAAAVARRCGPGLTRLRLASVTGMSGSAFGQLARALPGLEELHFTGHDRSRCRLTDKDLEPLKKEPQLLPNLRTLYLTDSGITQATAKQLCKARPKLTIHFGETDTDSIAGGLVRGLMGAEWGDSLCVERGKEAPGYQPGGGGYGGYDDFDDYGGYGGGRRKKRGGRGGGGKGRGAGGRGIAKRQAR